MATIPPQKGKKPSPSPRVVDVVDPRRRCLELVEKVAKQKTMRVAKELKADPWWRGPQGPPKKRDYVNSLNGKIMYKWRLMYGKRFYDLDMK